MMVQRTTESNYYIGLRISDRIDALINDTSSNDPYILQDIRKYLDSHGYTLTEMVSADTGSKVVLTETDLPYSDNSMLILEIRCNNSFFNEVLCTNIGTSPRAQTFFDWYKYLGKDGTGKHHFEQKISNKASQLTPP